MILSMTVIPKGFHSVRCGNCFGWGAIPDAATTNAWICRACEGKGYHVRPD